MRWLKTIPTELFGLIVDDGSFAVAIVVWLGSIWFLSAHFLHSAEWSGVLLFIGFGLILLENTMRRSRR